MGDDMRAGFEATTKLDRKEYGIIWNKTLDQGGTMLGDDVAISLEIEAVAAKQEASPAPAGKPEAKKKETAKSGK